MNKYKRLAEIPNEYFKDIPLNRIQVTRIVSKHKKKKKDFKSDDEFKTFLVTIYIQQHIDLVLEHLDNPEVRKYLTLKLLEKL